MKRFWMLCALLGAALLLVPASRGWSDDEPKVERKPVPRADGEGKRPDAPARREEVKREEVNRDQPVRREDAERAAPEGRPPRPAGDKDRVREGERPRDGDRPREGEPRREGDRPRDGQPMGPPLGPPPRDLERLKEQDPEMFELAQKDMNLERKTFEIAQQVRGASPQEREKMRESVKTLAGEHFAVRQQRRQLQLKRMEVELKNLKESMESREKQKDEIIQRRVNELLGIEGDMGF